MSAAAPTDTRSSIVSTISTRLNDYSSVRFDERLIKDMIRLVKPFSTENTVNLYFLKVDTINPLMDTDRIKRNTEIANRIADAIKSINSAANGLVGLSGTAGGRRRRSTHRRKHRNSHKHKRKTHRRRATHRSRKH